MATNGELPFSARYALPVQVAENLGDVSWETVTQLSTDFQAKAESKSSKVKKIIKELQMSRLLLMERIKEGSQGGRVDPKLLVDVVRLLQRCEQVMAEYGLDLQEFSTFLYLVSEKLKKEKLAHYHGKLSLSGMVPITEELDNYKRKSEGAARKKRGRKK